MLGKILIGGVTLAAAGYAVNEYCEEYGCPWDDDATSSSYDEDEKKTKKKEKVSCKKSLVFHKQKKALYKTSMTIYSEFLEKYDIKTDALQLDAKIQKQKFPDSMVDDEIGSYMHKITDMLEILTDALTANIKLLDVNKDTKIDEESIKLIHTYVKNIYALAHVPFFVDSSNGEAIKKITLFSSLYFYKFNKEEILSTLVEAMTVSIQKGSVHTDPSEESNENHAA